MTRYWYLTLLFIIVVWLVPMTRPFVVKSMQLSLRPFVAISSYLFSWVRYTPTQQQKTIDTLTLENSKLHATLRALYDSQDARVFAHEYQQRYAKSGIIAPIRQPLHTATSHQCILAKGTKHGVRPGMILLSPSGAIIGKLVSSASTSSTVKLISDPTVTLPITLSVNGMRCVAQGTGSMPPQLTLLHRAHTESISYPTKVVSSNATGEWPSGWLIGSLDKNGVITLAARADEIIYGVVIEN